MNKNARLCRFALQRTIITALLALVVTIGLAQTANDYWIAADKALAAGNTDSTFSIRCCLYNVPNR